MVWEVVDSRVQCVWCYLWGGDVEFFILWSIQLVLEVFYMQYLV